MIYVFDLSRPTTFKNISEDIAYLQGVLNGGVIRVVGNKRDLVTDEQLEQIRGELDTPFDIATSAKTGENVEDLFKNMGQALLD